MCFVLIIRPIIGPGRRPKGAQAPGRLARYQSKFWSWLRRNHPRKEAVDAAMEALSPTESTMFIPACDQVLSDTSCPPPYNNETAVTVLGA